MWGPMEPATGVMWRTRMGGEPVNENMTQVGASRYLTGVITVRDETDTTSDEVHGVKNDVGLNERSQA